MNKRKMMFMIAVSSLMFTVSGCSSDGGYEKLMKTADKAMVDFDIDQAIEAYNKVLEMEPKDLPYGASRLMIVENLLANANDLKNSIDELKQSTEALQQQFSKLEYTADKVDELQAFSYQLDDVHAQLEEYPNTQLYKDVAKMKLKYEEKVEKELISTLKKDIEKDTKELLFDSAEEKIDLLASLQGSFPEMVGDTEKYRSVIEEEKNKYIAFPFQVNEVNEVLYENKDIGKIILLGDNVKNGERTVYYKFEGDMRYVASEVDLNTKTILSNGEYRQSGSFSWSYYDGYTIGAQNIGDAEFDIARIDYSFNFMEEDQTKTVQYDSSDSKEMVIDGILALPEKVIHTPIVFEDEEKKVEIHTIQLLRNEVNLLGRIKPKKDIVLEGKVYVHRPTFDVASARTLGEELFAGITKDFELNFDFDEAIHNDEKFIQIYFMDSVFNLDLKTGKEYKNETMNLLETVYSVDGEYKIKYGNSAFLEDVGGTVYTNAVRLYQYFGWFSNSEPTTMSFWLDQKYTSVKMSVGLDKNYATPDHGTSKVSFVSDGKILKELTIAANAKTIPVELDISNTKNLQIILTQTQGNTDQQRIIIGNATLTMK